MLFSDGGCGGGIWISAVSAVPARMFAGDAGMVRNVEHGYTSAAIDRGERAGRRRDGRIGGAIGSGTTAFAAIVYSTFGSAAEHGGENAATAFCQKVDRRNGVANDACGDGSGIWMCAALQCGDSENVQQNSNANTTAEPAKGRECGK